MQPGAVLGAAVELHAARAVDGASPGVNSPLTTTWFDTSGNAKHGALTNFGGQMPWGGSGTPGDPYRLYFEGTDDRVQVPSLAAASDKTYTYEVWARGWPTSGATRVLASEGKSTDTVNFAYLFIGYISNVAYLRAAYRDGVNAVVITQATVPAPTDGLWHHLACRADGTTLRAYVDLAEVGSVALPAGNATLDRTTIGALGRSTYSIHYLGDLAVARVYPVDVGVAGLTQNHATGPLWMSASPFASLGGLGRQLIG